LFNLTFDGTAPSLDQICRGTAKLVDERGEGHKATAFFAKIKLHRRVHPALFTAGHVLDLEDSGVNSRSLQKVHFVFNNFWGEDEVHCRRKLGNAPGRLKLHHDLIKWEYAVTVACHNGKMYTRRQREWRVTPCAEDLDFAAVIFEDSVESFQKIVQKKYRFKPFLFNVATTFEEDPGRPVTMFGYPAFRKEMTFLFGAERSQDVMARLRKEITLAQGRDRDDLMRFEAGLKHTILYDIETHSGSSGTAVLNYKYEAKAIHVRSSPRPFNVLNEGTSFSVIADVLEGVL